MSEPTKRTRRKRDVVAEDAPAPVPPDCVYSAVSSRTCERGTNGCTVKHGLVVSATSTPSPDLQALIATMLDERFGSLREHIDHKLDAISSHLSAEVEKLSMRAVETGVSPVELSGDIGGTPDHIQIPALAELWWEHCGQTWPSPQEELSLESIHQSVEATAKASGRDPFAVLEALFKLYYSNTRVGDVGLPVTVSAIDLQLHLHDYIGAALVQVVPT